MENPCYEKCISDKSPNSNQNDKKNNRVSLLYPVIVGSPKTSLETVETESVESECEEWTGDIVKNNFANPQLSTINVEDSKDVVIGPLTQFHGPVTIYQNVTSDNPEFHENLKVQYKSDVIFNNSAKPTPDSSSSEKHHPAEKQFATSFKRVAIYVSIFVTMLLTIIVSLAISLNTTSNEESGDVEDINFPGESSKENSSLGDHFVVVRNRWGGRPPINFTLLLHPTEYVVIFHTAGRFCANFQNCAEIVRNIQSDHVARLKQPDIKYNFLIGGDGNIYVGRGWDTQNFHPPNSRIGVSFIGNFVYDTLTLKMISALEELLASGVKLDKLSPDYKLVCHNQTSSTLSPGENVYKEMVKFPNFYPGPI